MWPDFQWPRQYDLPRRGEPCVRPPGLSEDRVAVKDFDNRNCRKLKTEPRNKELPEQMTQALQIVQRIFGTSIVGAYLFGSAVVGGLCLDIARTSQYLRVVI